MSRPAQRWLFWLCVAALAFPIYVIREWLAALFLLGVVFAGLVALGTIVLLLDAAWRGLRTAVAAGWQASRAAMAVARTHLAKGIFAKVFADSNAVADSNTLAD
jgi:hypothetical protein